MSKNVEGKAFDFVLFKRIMTYVKPYNYIFYITAFLSIALASISLSRPILIQITIDDYIKKLDSEGLFYMTILPRFQSPDVFLHV